MANFKVAVECRPRIRSCHFFVFLEENPLTVEINEPNVVLIMKKNGEVLQISLEDLDDLKLACDSISGLQINEKSLYFQARSVPKNECGSFYRELIVSKKLDDKELPSMYKPDLKTNTAVELHCRTCQNSITKTALSFERILPLPSTDGSDFFCHKHSEFPTDLSPRIGDCLYGNYYIKINPAHFSITSNDVITCENCCSWLGIKEKSSVSLWNSCITFTNIDCIDVAKVGLQDFLSVVKFLMHKDMGVTCKLAFYCRISSDECHYLLLWIMDKDMTLLVDKSTEETKITLKEMKVAKVLYRFEKNISEIVKQWKNDFKVAEEQISKPMLMEGLKYLESMSCIIPISFRKTNEMNVSYV